MSECEKLPSIISLTDYNGDWSQYENALYTIFHQDFIESTPFFQGKPVDIIHQKQYKNKERSFWHIISEGKTDEDRLPIMERCECIGWIKSLITEDGECNFYRIWKKFHHKTNKERYYIWCTNVHYIVILEDRENHFKLITAYPVAHYNRRKYEKDYNEYQKTKTPT